MNSVNLVGYIGNELELQKTKEGKSVVKVNLGVRRNKDKTDWFYCNAYGNVAELIHRSFAKKSRIGITGQLYTEQYVNAEGKNVSTTKVFINDITFIDKKEDSETQPKVLIKSQTKTPEEIWADQTLNINSDDLPF